MSGRGRHHNYDHHRYEPPRQAHDWGRDAWGLATLLAMFFCLGYIAVGTVTALVALADWLARLLWGA